MHRVTMRSNVVELLVAVTASTAVAVLVLMSGLAIAEVPAAPGATTAFAGASTGRRLAAPEHEEIRPNAYLCCALVYADPGLSQ